MEASRDFSRTPRRLPPCSDVSVLQKTRLSHFLDTHHNRGRMFYSKAKHGTLTLFWTRTILDVRSLAGRRNDRGRTRVPRRPNTLINDREPNAGHSDEARHTDRRFHPV